MVLNSFCFSCGQGSKRTLSIKRKLSKYCEFFIYKESELVIMIQIFIEKYSAHECAQTVLF